MHAIRLRAPWKVFDGHFATPEGSPSVRYERRFNKPTGLSLNSRVLLAIEPLANIAAVTLNDQPLPLTGNAEAIRIEIASLLQPANRLTIELAVQPATISEELPFNVQLEIVD